MTPANALAATAWPPSLRRACAVLAACAALLLSTGADTSGCGGPTTGDDTAAEPGCVGATEQVLCWRQRVVYVEDSTGDDWPVTGAVATLQAALRLDVRYGKCRDGAGCVTVEQVDAMPDDYGQTYTHYNRRFEVQGTTTVRVSDEVRTQPGRRVLLLHELFHAVGWTGHDDDERSIMSATVDPDYADASQRRLWPPDVARVNRLYGG